MNLTTLHVPRDTARAKLRAIRSEIHAKADAKFQQLESVYQALVDEVPIIDVAGTMRAAPTFEAGLPRLAIARADRRLVTCRRWANDLAFVSQDDPAWYYRQYPQLWVDIDQMPKWSPPTDRPHTSFAEGRTRVPAIPAEVLQRMRDRKSTVRKNHHILWEVEAWDDVPDRDPLLLKHLGGAYYAILDHWDLTELEAEILGR